MFEANFQHVGKIFRFWFLCYLKALLLSFLKIYSLPFVYEGFRKYSTFQGSTFCLVMDNVNTN